MLGLGLGLSKPTFASVPLLLDTYSGAAAAYSLRKLSNTYSGSAIRVRESSGNTEADIGFVGGELDTTSLLAHCGVNDGFVVTWYDQSGNSNDATQSTAANQPQIVSGGSVLTKDGDSAILSQGKTNSHSMVTSGSVIAQTNNSYYVVASNININDAGVLFGTNGADNNNNFRCLIDTRTSPTRNLVVTISSTNYFADLSAARDNTNTRLLVGITDNSKNISAFDNGQTGGTDTFVGTFTNNNLTLTPSPASSALLELDGYIKEMIFYNKNTSTDRVGIETNINSYYSIYP